jgi:hypothetical protein
MATEESKRFAIETIQRAREYAEDFTIRVYGDAPRPLQGDALISLLRTNMWREYMLGVQGPAKLMTLIGNIDHLAVRYLLGTQIVDEMRHSNTFAARVRALGGDGELTHYEPTPEDLKLVEATLDFDNPAELVTSLNCTGEVILQQTFMRIVERKVGRPGIVDDETAELMERELIYDDDEDEVPPLVDEETAEELRKNVIPDEGRHVKFGRLVLQEYAATDEIRARCREVQDRKFEALDLSHGRAVADAKALSEQRV